MPMALGIERWTMFARIERFPWSGFVSWVCANAVGAAVGIPLVWRVARASSEAGDAAVAVVETGVPFVLAAAVVGLLQACVLRHDTNLGVGSWLLATALGTIG